MSINLGGGGEWIFHFELSLAEADPRGILKKKGF